MASARPSRTGRRTCLEASTKTGKTSDSSEILGRRNLVVDLVMWLTVVSNRPWMTVAFSDRSKET
jgi:hypothetical protein